MKRIPLAGSLVAATIAILFSAPSQGIELDPGQIRNPAGLQLYQRALYNAVEDSYLLLYTRGEGGVQEATIGFLEPGGNVVLPETAISGPIGVTHTNGAFNTNDGTALIVYRDGNPTDIFGQYITSDGALIGGPFMVGSGFGPNIAFSPESNRYVVTWENQGSGTVRYRVVDGDSTNPNPNLTAVAGWTGLGDGVAYGSVAQKFLVVYIRDLGGVNKANVYGRFISTDGTSAGSEFGIATGVENQQKPRVGYASSTNRWMVVWENWADCGGGCPHVRGALVSDTGTVVKGFPVANTTGWDVPGPITYNPVTETLFTGWRSAISDTNIQGRAGEFSPVDGSLMGPTVLLSDDNPGIEAAASRPDATNPQVLFIWRNNNGGDGIHAGFIDLMPPLPDTTPPEDVTDLSGEGVTGGTPIPATAIDSTNPGPSSQDMTKTTDGDAESFWSSPDRNVITPEFITWDLGATKTLSQVSLLSKSSGNLFPVDYQIQISTDNVNFTTVSSTTAAAPAPGTWVDHPLPSPAARYVKLLITKTKKSGTGKYKAQVAEVEILEATGASVALQFTAPGDDDDTGTAASYDLRWSSNPINVANFDSANSLATPNPSTAGTLESIDVTGFPIESRVYFALKASDEVPNTSGISNVIAVDTLGVPPAPVQGFGASSPTGTSVLLTWQPSGDDGNTGNAAQYDIRHSTAPIDDSNFDAAASVLVPATNPKPVLEDFILGGLANQTTYYFAIKALDELGNTSLLNGGGPVTATTLDALVPAAISDLSVEAGALLPEKLKAPAIAASGQSSLTNGKGKATDGKPQTHWSTPGRNVQQQEFITVDTRSVHRIGRVTLLSRASGSLFPEDLEIQLSSDKTTFVTVHSASGLPATPGTLHTFDFEPAEGRYVKILITKTRANATGKFFAEIAEIEVFEALPENVLTIRFTETGDDGALGTASSYDVRYSTSTIDNDGEFNGANTIDGEPAPLGPGTAVSFTFESPLEGVTLHFRMKAFDDVSNPSLLSNADSVFVVVPPAPVTDLLAFEPTSTTIDLSWRATGDDGNEGTATTYDVRYKACPFDFATATPAGGEPTPSPAGTLEQMTVTGLSPSTNYCFGVQVKDETGTPSGTSNVASATTDAPDATAPSNVSDLRGSTPFTVDLLDAPAIEASSVASDATSFTKATDGNLSSYWGTAGIPSPTTFSITLDTGSVHDIGQVRLRSRGTGSLFPEDLEIQVSDDNVNFTTIHTVTGLPATPGVWHDLTFPAGSGQYVRIFITKPRKTGMDLYYAHIAEIEVYEATLFPGPITLQWTAPGDDGPNGTATSYDLRRSTMPITDLTTFNAATAVSGEPAPQAAGSAETMQVNLPAGTYYFALRTADEALPPNQSGISNVPVIVVP